MISITVCTTDKSGEFGAVLAGPLVGPGMAVELTGLQREEVSLKVVVDEPSTIEIEWLLGQIKTLTEEAKVRVLGLEVVGSMSSGQSGQQVLEHTVGRLSGRLARLHLRWSCIAYSSARGLTDLLCAPEGTESFRCLSQLSIDDRRLYTTAFLGQLPALEGLEIRGANDCEPPPAHALPKLKAVRFAAIASWQTFDLWLGENSVVWAPGLESVVLDGVKMPAGKVFGELRAGLPTPDVGEFEAQYAVGVSWLAEALAMQAAVERVLSDGIREIDLPELFGDKRGGAACGAAVSRRLLKECALLSKIKLGSIADAIRIRPDHWLPESVPARESLEIHVKLDLVPSNLSSASIWLGLAVDRLLGWRAGPVSLCLEGKEQLRLRVSRTDVDSTVSCHGDISQLEGFEEQAVAEPLFDRLGSGIRRLDLSNSPMGARTLDRVHRLVLQGLHDRLGSLELGPHNDGQYSRHVEALDGFKAALFRSLEIPLPAAAVED